MLLASTGHDHSEGTIVVWRWAQIMVLYLSYSQSLSVSGGKFFTYKLEQVGEAGGGGGGGCSKPLVGLPKRLKVIVPLRGVSQLRWCVAGPRVLSNVSMLASRWRVSEKRVPVGETLPSNTPA